MIFIAVLHPEHYVLCGLNESTGIVRYISSFATTEVVLPEFTVKLFNEILVL